MAFRAILISRSCAWLWLYIFFWLAAPLFAQEDDPERSAGLAATYRAGGKSAVRVEPDVAFEWGAASPDPRLPRGPFSVRFSGQLLIREDAPFRLHAFVQGKVAVKIDGRTVLSGNQTSPAWASGDPSQFGFGERPIEIEFNSSAPKATLKLFWSSDRFPLEPLPSYLLFHDATAISGAAGFVQLETGRRQFEAHRCSRCHRRTPAFSMAAPSLVHVSAGLSSNAILEKIAPHAARSPDERMPNFSFTPEEARALTAFLIRSARPAVLEESPEIPVSNREVRKGADRVRSIGCLACHSVARSSAKGGAANNTPLGTSGLYGGPDLSRVGSRRNVEWLWTWLAKPEAIDADHRMPVFRLSNKERRQIVAYLATLKAPASNTTVPAVANLSDESLICRGRDLAVRARCAACHQIQGMAADFAGLPDLREPVHDWKQSCLGERAEPGDSRTNRALFQPTFPQADRAALRAYVDAHAGPLESESGVLCGARLLERKNCTACHARGNQPGLGTFAAALARGDESLRGRSEVLIPPSLTSVGDKLTDKALAEAIVGGAKRRRLPWLEVHMPRFRHSDPERAALLAGLISHDRIPANAPDSAIARTIASTTAAPMQPSADPKHASLLNVGQQLVGAKGWSCIACHDMGKAVPKNVAIPTHGSNLIGLGNRMRREYFLRWTRSPLRIRPGMEMPSYERPVIGLLENNVGLQLAALWDALNNPRFTLPIDQASVEQFFVVQPGEPARVVRDVFQDRDGKGHGVPRAFAVGFNNGHSLLIDLDTFCIRDWRVGDFAAQRTAGKSWSWEMTGTPVAGPFEPRTDVLLAHIEPAGTPPLLPKPEFGSAGRLDNYRPIGNGLEFSYRLRFQVDGKPRWLGIHETLTPLARSANQSGGVRRTVGIVQPIAGYEALLRVPTVKLLVDGAAIECQDANHPSSSKYLAPFHDRAGGVPSVMLDYRSPTSTPVSAAAKRSANKLSPDTIVGIPGFDGLRLPLERSIMPTAITWTADGTLAFTSLKGHVYFARDADGDGIEDRLDVFEEGLAAPYGLIADGHDLIVAHKPELLRLSDSSGRGRADRRSVLATGWGYSDDYHDWTCGIVRDPAGFFYVGLGSDYNQKVRPEETARWRGKILRIGPDGQIKPIAHAMRYPTGLAMDAQGRLFATDNQGDQNPFNEINHVVEGRHYGVPALYEEHADATATPPAIQIPHPWTRSVNGICFLPASFPYGLGGQGIGCEYNRRFLVRFTLQQVDDIVQGAVYPFSQLPDETRQAKGESRPAKGERRQTVPGSHNFMGPLSCAVSPAGDLVIGGIQDSGWLGGTNVGEIVRLRANAKMPNGIREIRATSGGFEIAFFAPVDRQVAERPSNYTIAGYKRTWTGSYATNDTGRHRLAVLEALLSADGQTIALTTERPREGSVYEVSCGELGNKGTGALFPSTGYYTLHRVPGR